MIIQHSNIDFNNNTVGSDKGNYSENRLSINPVTGQEYELVISEKIDGNIEEVKGLDMIYSKWNAFGFNVIETDGNNIEKLIDSFEEAKMHKGSPSIIIAKTVKGKGVSFMENKVEWHGKAPSEEEYKIAIKELSK